MSRKSSSTFSDRTDRLPAGVWLKRHFPGVQFIVTTHSPFICQAADPKGLIRLPVPGSGECAEHVPEGLFREIVHGGADAAAMTELFGLEHAHSSESEALRERAAALEAKFIRNRIMPDEEAELERLRHQLPTTVPPHPPIPPRAT